MPNFTTVNPLGDSIESSEITALSVDYSKLGIDLFKKKLLVTLNASGDSSIGSDVDAYNFYIVEFNLVPSSNISLSYRINGLSSAYDYTMVNLSTGVIARTASSSYGKISFTAGAQYEHKGYMILAGNTNATNTEIGVDASNMCIAVGGANNQKSIGGNVTIGASKQITNINLYASGGTITGSIKIYGVK